uniref:SET domain-containing protein n=1 Tax=Sinocyclocheilus anshuiensis TaxID=1608454 RepID=A0A671KIN9_9TELE
KGWPLRALRGKVVCDYHGEVVSKQEGERRLETLTGEPSYLFFFKGKGGKPLCIDAQKFPCDCHPDQETYGRRMNHSCSKNSVRPQRVSLKFLDGPRECVLFFALQDIAVSEELLWDYGVRRTSFQGEGWDLSCKSVALHTVSTFEIKWVIHFQCISACVLPYFTVK